MVAKSVNGGEPGSPAAGSKRFKGVRMRSWGKWVSEIRLPNSRARIWLGSYATAEQAARAFDVAVACLRGRSASFNFPDSPPAYAPMGLAHKQIQELAAAAAAPAAPSPPATAKEERGDSGCQLDSPCASPASSSTLTAEESDAATTEANGSRQRSSVVSTPGSSALVDDDLLSEDFPALLPEFTNSEWDMILADKEPHCERMTLCVPFLDHDEFPAFAGPCLWSL